jgi:hypothetical protein
MSGQRDPARVAIGIGAAVSLLVVAGLVLSALGDLHARGWLAALALGALGTLILGWRSGSGLARDATPWLLGAIAVAVTVGAVSLSRAGARDQARETRFTQLWALPAAGGRQALIGVRNQEHRPAGFELKVLAPSGGPKPLLERSITLAPSQSWTATVALPATPTPERVDVQLLRNGQATPYRSVHLWTVAQK